MIATVDCRSPICEDDGCPECDGWGEISREQGFARLEVHVLVIVHGGDPADMICHRTETGGRYVCAYPGGAIYADWQEAMADA